MSQHIGSQNENDSKVQCIIDNDIGIPQGCSYHRHILVGGNIPSLVVSVSAGHTFNTWIYYCKYVC